MPITQARMMKLIDAADEFKQLSDGFLLMVVAYIEQVQQGEITLGDMKQLVLGMKLLNRVSHEAVETIVRERTHFRLKKHMNNSGQRRQERLRKRRKMGVPEDVFADPIAPIIRVAPPLSPTLAPYNPPSPQQIATANAMMGEKKITREFIEEEDKRRAEAGLEPWRPETFPPQQQWTAEEIAQMRERQAQEEIENELRARAASKEKIYNLTKEDGTEVIQTIVSDPEAYDPTKPESPDEDTF